MSISLTLFILNVFYISSAEGHRGQLKLNYLTLAEPPQDISKHHGELRFDYKFEDRKVSHKNKQGFETVLANVHPTTALMTNDESYWNYVFDFNFYGATYTDYAFLLPEAYVEYTSGSSSLVVGRKHPEIQLFVDKMWKQGIDQAFFRMNPFHAESQGRLAASYVYKSESVMVEAFVSPFSIPDQGPSFDFKNGQATSNNPWASRPPSQLELSETGTFNLSYDVQDDSIPDVIDYLQYGVALSVMSDYVKIDGFYYNKPAKQLGLELEPVLDPDTVGVIDVLAKPFFIREHIFGVQLESKWLKNLTVTNGFYGMAVDTSELENDVEYRTEISDYFLITNAFHLNFDWSTFVIGHFYRRVRPYEEPGTFYVENSRFLHGNALKLGLTDLIYNRWKFSSELLYGTEEKGLFFETRADYQLRDNLFMFAQLNFIEDFQDRDSQSSFSESVFSKFSGLDNIRLGVGYVF